MTTDKKLAGRFSLRVVAIVGAMALVGAFCARARAELVPLDTANALAGWYGTKIIQFEETNGNFVNGSVDYAVYAPGQFNLSFPGQDPSSGACYVYRYQLHNDGEDTSDYMKKLTVGLKGYTGAANSTWIEPDTGPYDAGGIIPTAQVGFAGLPATPTSAIWAYLGDSAVDPGESSKILLFTSPNAPMWRSASVYSQSTAAGTYWRSTLPSPVPEPASLVSLVLFLACCGGYRALRRE